MDGRLLEILGNHVWNSACGFKVGLGLKQLVTP